MIMSGVALNNSSMLLFGVLLLQSVKYVISISCYHCTIRPPPWANQTATLCSQFDYSKKYIVDCPYSTFCMNKTFRLPLQKNGAYGTKLGTRLDGADTSEIDMSGSLSYCQRISCEEYVDITIRGCAPQKYIRQTYVNGEWKAKESIKEDIYTVGCKNTDNSAGLKVNSELYCFCNSSLCNSGQSTSESTTHSDIMTVIFIFNALKYIRSITQ